MTDDAVLTAKLDPASDRAIYKQIADHLREAVARGRLHPGDQLPSETRLMEHYGVARMTIRSALRLLQDEGLTTAEHGRGVYVRARPPVRRLASDRFAQRHRKYGGSCLKDGPRAETSRSPARLTTDQPSGACSVHSTSQQMTLLTETSS